MARPRLWFDGARAAFLGPGFGLPAHRNATAFVAFALDGDLGVAIDPDDPAAGWRRARSVWLDPGTRQRLDTRAGRFAFVYLDPARDDLAPVRGAFTHPAGPCALGHRDEATVLARWQALLREGREATAGGWPDALAAIGMTSAPASRRDAAIAAAIARLRDGDAWDEPGAASAAAQAARTGLSRSRFLHRFRVETAVPWRRYRLWVRMQRAVVLALGGATLTEAAHGAGFSSSAHFSAAFRIWFGLTPTQLIASRPVLVVAHTPGRE